MMEKQLIHKLVEEKDLVTPLLFKPVQFTILQKLDRGDHLTANEQRYLRGRLKQKLQVLQTLAETKPVEQELALILNRIGPYYITGLEALRHNGFGWFYDTKMIEVINTKIKGKITLGAKTIIFVKIKSLAASEIVIDSETNFHYASNDQIRKDVKFTKNKYALNLWMQMYQQYGKTFAKEGPEISVETAADYAQYGV